LASRCRLALLIAQEATYPLLSPGPSNSMLDLAGGGVYPADTVTGAAVRSYRTISPLPVPRAAAIGCVFSVALSRGLPRVAVSHHRALSCSDFPPALFRAGDRPTHSFQLTTNYQLPIILPLTPDYYSKNLLMRKYNILIIYDVPGWAYHLRAEALKKYAPQDFSVTVSAASAFQELLQKETFELIFFLPFSHVNRLRAHCNQTGINPVILTSFNVGWGYANDWLEKARTSADAVVINNYRMWDKSGRLENTYYLPNGVDTDAFRCDVPVENRKPKALWCGSEFHRKTKGYDSILVPLKEKLKDYDLDLDLRLVSSTGSMRYSSRQMAQWYNTGTIYVCASLAEGTPNPALEAASCGCTIVSTPVGNMPELIQHGVNGYIVKWDVEAFLLHILQAVNHQIILSRNMLRTVQSWSWKVTSDGFYKLFRQLIEKRRIKP